MKSKFTWILTLFLVFTVQMSFAQEKTVTGVVTAKDYGDPVPGASVMIEGTKFGVETDMEGRYSLKAKPGDRLVVKFTGFKDAKVTVGSSNTLNISIVEEAAEELEDLVIDVYRTTSKPKSAVAASTVTSKTIEGRPNASFIQTLQGQVPGLNISTGSGQPGDNNTTVILRGLGSINGAVEPLYVIDGVPMSSDRFRSLNPNDIDNITVLKDAGATAIYGNRGANGVIVVNTKRASFASDLEVKYVGTTGMSFLQDNGYNLMNAKEYRAFERQAYRDYRVGRNVTQAQIDAARDGNWVDVFFRDAIAQNHTLSFSAGSKNLSSYTSVGYSDNEGILKNTGLKRFNFRNNLNGKNSDGRLTFGTNISANYSKSNLVTGTGTNGVNQNFFLGAFQSLPYLVPEEYEGTYESIESLINTKYGLVGMPFLLMDKARTSAMKQDEFKLIASGNINYQLSDDWSVGTSLGADYQTINQFSYISTDAFNSRYFAADDQEYYGSIGDINERRVVVTSTTNLRWNKVFNEKHELKMGGYVEYIKAHYKNSSISKEGFDPIFWTPGAATGWIDDMPTNDYYAPTASVSFQNSGLFSYFGTADYDYDTKYGVSLTGRRDASFRFVDDNKWGTFWSVSARWNINNEKFMEGSIFNDLKIRGSYGTAGNQDITGSGLFGGAYLYETVFASAAGYNKNPSLDLAQLPNRALQWETITSSNIGLDFGIFENRLRGSVDVYRKQTDDLYQGVPLSAINGTTNLMSNFGSLKNEGVEVIVAGDVIRTKNTRLTLNANGSYNKNTVVDIPNEGGEFWNGTSLTGLREGGKIGEFYLTRYAGINPANGNYLFYDKDGNTTETPVDEDRVWTGKSSLPVYQGAFGFDFEHKGFFASASFTFAKDVWRFDNDYFFFTQPSFIGQNNMSGEVRDYWTPTNTGAEFPSLTARNLDYIGDSDYYVKDASYIRLRYATLGYNFNKKDLSFLKLSGLRVYAQAENLVTWTKWKGWDAESNRGVDLGQYPTPRTVSFGVEVQF